MRVLPETRNAHKKKYKPRLASAAMFSYNVFMAANLDLMFYKDWWLALL